MKKHLLSLFTAALLLICSGSIAQQTLTASGINPQIGENYSWVVTSYMNPGNPGANQTWDLSSMSGTTTTYSYLASASTPQGSLFPNANIAIQMSAGNGYMYLKTSSSALQLYGVSSSSINMSYSNPEDMLHFPFSFGNNYSDYWAVQFQNSGYACYRFGNTSVTADGWGTLITPGGTFTNAMRVHYVQDYKDSMNIGIPYVITYNNDEYIWYKEGTHIQLATVYTLTTSVSGNTTGGSYVSANVGIDENKVMPLSTRLFPNPASDNLNIEFSLPLNQKVEARLYNTLGQQILPSYEANGNIGENTINIDIAELEEGFYLARIFLDGNVASSQRFIISRR